MSFETSVTFTKGPKITFQVEERTEGLKAVLTQSNLFTFTFPKSQASSFIQSLFNWLEAYGEKKKLPLLILPRQILPPFSEKVLKEMEAIPLGKTLSYQDLALKSGSPKASRAVGTICRLNSWPLLIPCHRVLPKQRSIGNYAFGTPIKKLLLEFENAI